MSLMGPMNETHLFNMWRCVCVMFVLTLKWTYCSFIFRSNEHVVEHTQVNQSGWKMKWLKDKSVSTCTMIMRTREATHSKQENCFHSISSPSFPPT